jgi:hypothetical protein
MSKNKNWNNKVIGFSGKNDDKEKKENPNYRIHEMNDSGKLIIPADVLSQITYLHASIGKTEWSGILFYDVKKGNVSNPKNFELEAKYIYLMDVGSASYTEYEPDSDLIDVYDKFEEAINWKTGHVHTHHGMGAFFSGTDTDELKENVDKYNYYLSLIVNFDGKYCAKVAFLSDVNIESGMNYSDESGKKHVFKIKEKETRMVVINMDILYGIDSFTKERIIQINKKIEEEEAKKQKSFSTGNFNNRNQFGNNKGFDDEYYYGYNYGGYGNDYGRDNKTQIAQPDPSNLTTSEVEKFTRNLISVNPELSEIRAVYSVLSEIAEDTKQGGIDMYYDYLAENIDTIIEAFFEGPLVYNQLAVVFDEVIRSINRFSTNFHLRSLTQGIVEVITEFMEIAKEEEQEEEDEEMNKKVLTLNQKNE